MYMSATPRISLEQWRALQAVVDAGGYAQAAEMLHKSQSAVTYAVQKLESLLDVKVCDTACAWIRDSWASPVINREVRPSLRPRR